MRKLCISASGVLLIGLLLVAALALWATGKTKTLTQGSLVCTSNTLDLAIEGTGAFQIIAPDGRLIYTRDGSFRINDNSELVTADGYLLHPRITFPQDSLSVEVSIDGTVWAWPQSSPGKQFVGTITLATFPNAAGLSCEDGKYFSETPASGAAAISAPCQNGTGKLWSGFRELPPEGVAVEMLNLIRGTFGF